MTGQVEMNTKVMKVFLWSGPVVVLGLLVGQLGFMHFLPPPSPTLSAQRIAHEFISRKNEIRLGSVILCIMWTFWVTWSTAITMFIRKMERSVPVLTYASIALIGGGLVFFLLIPLTWAVCAYRPEALDPSVLQMMNDWVWFLWLFTWPPFVLWMVIIGVAIFNDHNVPTLYPRWVAYLNCWFAFFCFPAGLIAFFKKGPFAYDGVFAFWMPCILFFGWMIVMTVTTFKVINREDARLVEEARSTDSAATPFGDSVALPATLEATLN